MSTSDPNVPSDLKVPTDDTVERKRCRRGAAIFMFSCFAILVISTVAVAITTRNAALTTPFATLAALFLPYLDWPLSWFSTPGEREQLLRRAKLDLPWLGRGRAVQRPNGDDGERGSKAA